MAATKYDLADLKPAIQKTMGAAIPANKLDDFLSVVSLRELQRGLDIVDAFKAALNEYTGNDASIVDPAVARFPAALKEAQKERTLDDKGKSTGSRSIEAKIAEHSERVSRYFTEIDTALAGAQANVPNIKGIATRAGNMIAVADLDAALSDIEKVVDDLQKCQIDIEGVTTVKTASSISTKAVRLYRKGKEADRRIKRIETDVSGAVVMADTAEETSEKAEAKAKANNAKQKAKAKKAKAKQAKWLNDWLSQPVNQFRAVLAMVVPIIFFPYPLRPIFVVIAFLMLVRVWWSWANDGDSSRAVKYLGVVVAGLFVWMVLVVPYLGVESKSGLSLWPSLDSTPTPTAAAEVQTQAPVVLSPPEDKTIGTPDQDLRDPNP